MQANEQTFWEHVSEFRKLFLNWLLTFITTAIFAHIYYEKISSWLLSPLNGQYELQFLGPLDPLIFIISIDLFTAFIITLPLACFLLIQYVKPAISNELTWSSTSQIFFLITSFALVGAIYAYQVVIPNVLQFLLTLTVPGVVVQLAAREYVHFFISMILMHVLIFQTPIIVFSICFMRLVTTTQVAQLRKYIYLALSAVIAVITPTIDAVTFLFLFLPTVVLFEFGLLAARLTE